MDNSISIVATFNNVSVYPVKILYENLCSIAYCAFIKVQRRLRVLVIVLISMYLLADGKEKTKRYLLLMHLYFIWIEKVLVWSL